MGLLEDLKNQINKYLSLHVIPSIRAVQLDKGSEDSDLSANADVIVLFQDGQQRDFSIVSAHWMIRLASEQSWARFKGDVNKDIFTTGNPFVIVQKITGDSIIRGILQYLSMEINKQT